jgi:hypothetical protein
MAWAALWRGQLWICWRESPRCWRRIDARGRSLPADILLDPETADSGEPDSPARTPTSDLERLAFVAPDELVLIDADANAWRVRRYDDRLRSIDARTLPAALEWAHRPRPMTCSPTGMLPLHDGRAWTWVPAPCTHDGGCTRAAPVFPFTAPTGLSVSLGVQVSLTRSVGRVTDFEQTTLARDADIQILGVVALAFDPWSAGTHRRRLRALQHAASELLPLPGVAPGPLAAAERRALRAAVCREGG